MLPLSARAADDRVTPTTAIKAKNTTRTPVGNFMDVSSLQARLCSAATLRESKRAGRYIKNESLKNDMRQGCPQPAARAPLLAGRLAQRRVNAVLPAWTVLLEKLQYVAIDAQRHRF